MSNSSTGLTICVRLRPVLENLEHKLPKSRVTAQSTPTRGRSGSAAAQSYLPYVKWKWDTQRVTYTTAHAVGATQGQTSTFTCNHVFAPQDKNETVYGRGVQPVLERMLREGTDSCVLMYGQTNSGKTYTTFGEDASQGVLPRCVNRIFTFIENEVPRGTHALLRVSLFEVYNEVVRDLLVEDAPTLVLKDHPTQPYTLTGASEHIVANLADVLALIAEGQQRRASGTNNVHEHASRSHCLVKLTLERTSGLDVKQTTLYVVDLAGSESNYLEVTEPDAVVREKKELDTVASRALGTTATVKKDAQTRTLEGSNIRRSLLALVRCVTMVGQKKAKAHIPYRESKLTRILRHALCGHCNLVVICTVDPTEDKETLSTLRFASMAQKVQVQQRKDMHDAVESVLETFEERMRSIEEEIILKNLEHETTLQSINREAEAECARAQRLAAEAQMEEASLQAQYDDLWRHIIPGGERRGDTARPRIRRRHSYPHPVRRFDADAAASARRRQVPPSLYRTPDFDAYNRELVEVVLRAEKKRHEQRDRDRAMRSTRLEELKADLASAEDINNEAILLQSGLEADNALLQSQCDAQLENALDEDEKRNKIEIEELEKQYRELQDLYLQVGRVHTSLQKVILKAPTKSGGCSAPPPLKEAAYLPSVEEFKAANPQDFGPLFN